MERFAIRRHMPGTFERKQSRYRNWITPDGAPGPTGEGGFAAEPGRYHLYVSHACPWAHRTTIFRLLKGLEGMVSLSVVNWHMGPEGWTFDPGPGVIPDPIHHARRLADVYAADPMPFDGHATTPLLWDKRQGRVVSNESSEVIRMFNSAFDAVGAVPGDWYPEHLRAEIDAINDPIYHKLNNGVYRAGFATTQDAYDGAARGVFEMLDALELRLGTRRYLCGTTLTEADWRLFTTLLRFDLVYHGHFKCNVRRIVDYPVLSNYLRELYQYPGIRGTMHVDHIKNHYYGSHPKLNPTGIVPIGPEVDLDAPHDRARLPAD
jgi:putative glutathione S-transferase